MPLVPLLLALATPVTVAALPPEQSAGRGASVPFLEYEAENGSGAFTLVGPDRTFGTIAAEASGRKAVLLKGSGAFVEFTLAAEANAITVRHALPDSPRGGGIHSTLTVLADGRRVATLPLTSRYSWLYGRYPFSNDPSKGGGHHVFDESRLLLARTLPAGTRVRLELGEGGAAPWVAIDLADFELVSPPGPMPAGAMPITAFGADPSGDRESSAAVRRAIAAARRKRVPVWIPPGTYRLERHIEVDQVAILGAGPWHSILRGRGGGLYGRRAPRGSTEVTLRDFAIIGEVDERDDRAALAGVGGAMGGGSRIENLFIQHHKTGLWFDGPLDGLTIRGVKIVDNVADGLNFRRGVRNAVVENSFVRNSGDDGLAMWSHRGENRGNAFRRNTVIAPTLANGIAIYGGRDIEVSGNLVADTVTQGGGIHAGNRFHATALAGTIRFADNLIVRSGSFDHNWRFGVGALWFYALDSAIDAKIEVRNVDIIDSTLPALHVIGKPIRSLLLDGVRIDGAGGAAIQIQSAGDAAFMRVKASGTRGGGIMECGPGFLIIDAMDNEGWQAPATQACPR